MQLSPSPIYGSPRDRDLFVGREAELRRAVAAVASGLNTLVVGPRRIGKSSFLHRLGQLLHDPDHGQASEPAPGYQVTTSDGTHGGSAPVMGDAGDLRAVYVPGEQASGARELLTECFVAVSDNQFTARMAARTTEELGDVIELFRQDVAAQVATGRRVVVLLDDPDEAGFHMLFGRFRDLIWQIEATWVVAGSAGRALYMAPPADAFFSAVVQLGPLSHDESLELLRRRLPDVADTDVLERLVDMAQGDPNVLLQVAVDIFVNHADLADVEHNTWRLDEVAARLGRPATMLVAELLSLGPVSASDPVLLSKLGWTRPRLLQVLQQLEEAGVAQSERAKVDGKSRRLFWLTSGAGAKV
jgi:hypothetical protein